MFWQVTSSYLNFLAYILIDFGVIHSFVSLKFVHKMSVMVESSRFPSVVSIASVNMLTTDDTIKMTRMEIDGRSLEIDLHVTDMNEFNVILGMDLLSKNHVKILCFKNEEVFLRLGEDQLHLSITRNGTLHRVISTMKARWTLQLKGIVGFFISLTRK